jgi:outer membrane autotransporter protein
MTTISRSFRVVMMLTLSLACAALAVLWPGWLTSLRAQTGYPPVIDIVSGNNQANLAGATLAAFTAIVTRGGQNSPNETVTWSVSPGGGTLSNGSTTSTGGNGQTSNTLTFGTTQQTVTVTATVTGGNTVTFTATCTTCTTGQPPGAFQISISSGGGQTGGTGTALAPFVVHVTQNGQPASGVNVSWAVNPGGGTLSGGASTPVSGGTSSNTLTLGTVTAVTVQAAVPGGNSVTFAATCSNCAGGGPLPPPPPPTPLAQILVESANQGLQQATTLAPTSFAAAHTQATNIGLRLLNLRRGGPAISAGGLSLNMDGQSVPVGLAASGLFSLGEKGGGASADPTGLGGLGLGVFVNGIGSFGDQRASSREPGFDFHTLGLTAGVDYRVLPQLVLGAAFGYASVKTDFDANAGEMNSNTYSVSVYASYFLGASFHLDGIFTYGWNDYDTKRNIVFPGVSATAKADPSGNQLAVGANAGYDFHFGGLTVGPSFRVSYVNVDVDKYRERGAGIFDLSVKSQNAESLTTALGGEVSYAISVPFGVLTPLVRFEWEHEYLAGSRIVQGTLISDPSQTLFAARTNNPDRDYFNLGAGITGTFRSGVSAFFYWETILGQSRVTNHLFTLGVRVDF